MKLLNYTGRRLLTLTILFIFSASLAFSQTADKDNAKKLKEIKGAAKKITITTSEGTTTFEGSDAEWLLERMQKDAHKKRIKVMLDDEDFEGIGKLHDFDIDLNLPDHDVILKRFRDDDSANGTKKIIVEVENGEKSVTVTETDKEGKVKTETYSGKKAEEYLKQHEIEIKKMKDNDIKDLKKKEKKKIIILEK